jgi:endosialidase-like protein
MSKKSWGLVSDVRSSVIDPLAPTTRTTRNKVDLSLLVTNKASGPTSSGGPKTVSLGAQSVVPGSSPPTAKLGAIKVVIPETPNVKAVAPSASKLTVIAPKMTVTAPKVDGPAAKIRLNSPKIVVAPKINVRPPNAPKVSAPVVPSDVRLKRDIVQIGQLANGLPIYRYRYLWDDALYVGVMAQDIAATVPEAVVRGSDGYLWVAYDRLGLKFMTWTKWLTENGEATQEKP